MFGSTLSIDFVLVAISHLGDFEIVPLEASEEDTDRFHINSSNFRVELCPLTTMCFRFVLAIKAATTRKYIER